MKKITFFCIICKQFIEETFFFSKPKVDIGEYNFIEIMNLFSEHKYIFD